MSTPQVEDFLFDHENEAEMARHGLTPDRVDQVLDNEYAIVKNRRRRRAPLLLIGHDNGGMFISVPVEPTREQGMWRPVTAWPSKEFEVARFRQLRRRNDPTG